MNKYDMSNGENAGFAFEDGDRTEVVMSGISINQINVALEKMKKEL